MTPVWDRDGRAVEAWMPKHNGSERGFGPSVGLAAVDGLGRMRGGALFHDWWPEHGTIEITIAGETGFMTRTIAREAMGYVFSFARMLIGRTSEGNAGARRLWRGLGGDEYRIHGLWGPDEDGMILTLTEAQWKESRLRATPKSCVI